jgi:hypothetical protein
VLVVAFALFALPTVFVLVGDVAQATEKTAIAPVITKTLGFFMVFSPS